MRDDVMWYPVHIPPELQGRELVSMPIAFVETRVWICRKSSGVYDEHSVDMIVIVIINFSLYPTTKSQK